MHFVALNSNIFRAAGSAQEQWVARRLDREHQAVHGRSLAPPRNGVWQSSTVDLSAFAGRTVRLHVLDLASGTDTPLAEPAHVDDQPSWLDSATIGYTRPHEGRNAIFTVPADGTGGPRLLLAGASSPAALP